MDGLVVEQQPRAGSRIAAGSQVTIFVGRFSGQEPGAASAGDGPATTVEARQAPSRQTRAD
jgi:beta-lactam-binding protein with PASTA domain